MSAFIDLTIYGEEKNAETCGRLYNNKFVSDQSYC